MANTRKPKTLADIAAVTKPLEKVVSLCVRGDLFAEHERLEEELEADDDELLSIPSRSRKLNNGADPEQQAREEARLAKAEELKKLEAKMAEFTFEFRFRALPRHEWSQLLDAHPPRKDNKLDQDRYGYNFDTFSLAAVQACCVEPEGMDDEQVLNGFWETLNSAQRNKLYLQGAWAANQDGASVPKSGTASRVIRSSGQNSSSAAG